MIYSLTHSLRRAVGRQGSAQQRRAEQSSAMERNARASSGKRVSEIDAEMKRESSLIIVETCV